MDVQNLKLVKVQQRHGQGGGLITVGVLTMVIGGALLLAGVFTSAKLNESLDLLSGGEKINSTSYCSSGGTWNGSDCSTGTVTDLPDGYDAQTTIQGNLLDALEIGGVVVIFVGIGLLIAGVRGLGA